MQNFMRVRRAKVFLPERGVVAVSGDNKSGKTGFVRGLIALVAGAGTVEENPRNRDAPDDEPSYTIGSLTDGTSMSRTITGAESAPKGNFAAKDVRGHELRQSHFTSLVGKRSVDPQGFFKRTIVEQRDIVLSFVPGLMEIMGFLFEERETLVEQRSEHIFGVTRMNNVPLPEGERPEMVDVSAEMTRLSEYEAQEVVRSQVKLVMDKLTEEGTAKRRLIDTARAEVSRLERLLAEERVILARHESERETLADGWVTKNKEWGELPDMASAVEAVKAHISQANQVNESLEPWNEYDRAQVSLEDHRRKRAYFDEQIAEVELRKTKALEDAELPFTEVSFDEEGALLIGGGKPSQASGMEKGRFVLEVAMAEDPKLGVVFMTGNEMDREALEEVHRIATEFDFQVIMDVIHSPGMDGEIRMVDGVAHQDELKL